MSVIRVARTFQATTKLSRTLCSRSPPWRSRSPQSTAAVATPDAADEGEEEESLAYGGGSSVINPVMMPAMLQPGVVIYDGVCHLCHGGVKWVIKADKYRKIKFCCLQSRAAEPYMSLCGLDREDVSRRFLFVEGPGLYHQASTAALKVMSHLPLPYSALSTLMIIPTPLRDAVYDHVAKKRYDWFGKADDCLILQDQHLLDRFIDRDEIFNRSSNSNSSSN